MKKIMAVALTSISLAHAEGIIDARSSNKMISNIVAQTYLQCRKNHIQKDSYLFKENSEEEKIFGKSFRSTESTYGIDITIRQEFVGDNAFVIMIIDVIGSPEDFEGKNILEVEKGLLKYMLINAYLLKLREMQSDSSIIPTTVPIDAYTKSTLPPTPMVHVTKEHFFEKTVESKDRKSMQFVTIFPASEFDVLIKEFFLDKKDKKDKKNSWW